MIVFFCMLYSDKYLFSDVVIKMEVDNEAEEDQAEKELHSALNKARKLKERKIMATAPEKVNSILY